MPKHFWPVLALLIGLLAAGFIPVHSQQVSNQPHAQVTAAPQPGSEDLGATMVIPNSGLPENSPEWLPGFMFLVLVALLLIGVIVFLLFGSGTKI